MGEVPVDADGSACFRVPARKPVYFQAVDSAGRAVQTMRSLTYVQPQQTFACIGCHESRDQAPAVGPTPLAADQERATWLLPGATAKLPGAPGGASCGVADLGSTR